MEKKLTVYAGIVINSEQDIAKLLLKNPDHWIKDVMENYSIDDIKGCWVPLYTDTGEPAMREITKDNVNNIMSFEMHSVAQYSGRSLHKSEKVSTMKFDDAAAAGITWAFFAGHDTIVL